MELTVCNLAGEVLCVVEGQGLAGVNELKDKIYFATKIPSHLQKLLLGNRVLSTADALPELLAESDSRELLLIRSDKWIEEVQQDWRRLRKSSEAVRNDVELVLAAIQTSKGQAIKYAGTEIRSNRVVMEAAMAFDPNLCRYATGALHEDREFLLKALQQSGEFGSFRWQSSALCGDPDFMAPLLRRDGAWLRFAAEEVRAEKQLVMLAIESAPLAFQYASPDLKADREVAGKALQRDLHNLMHVCPDLLKDRDFVLLSLRQRPHQLLQTGGSILQHLPQELRVDPEVVDLVQPQPQHPKRNSPRPQAARSPRAPRARGGRKMEKGEKPEVQLSEEVKKVLQNVDVATQGPEFWLPLIERDALVLGMVDEDLQDKRLILAAVKKSGEALAFAKQELCDLEILRAALKNSERAYDFIPEDLRVTKEVALLALELRGKKLPKELLKKEICVAAAQIQQAKSAWRSEGEATRCLKKLERMSLANLIAEYQLA